MENGVRERSRILPMVALLRDAISNSVDSALQKIFSKDLSVKLSEKKIFLSYFNLLQKKVESVEKIINKISNSSEQNIETNLSIQKENRELAQEFYGSLNNIQEYLDILKKQSEKSNTSLQALSKKDMIVNVPPFPKLEIPKTQEIKGIVKIDNQISLKNLEDKLTEVKEAISSIVFPKFPDIKIPEVKIPKYPESISLKDKAEILEALSNLETAIKNINIPEVDFPRTIEVSNFPIPKYPIPPTRISLNPLRGYVKSTAISVTTVPTGFPSNSLRFRRSLIIYNNSSKTIYIGGTDVTVDDGIPVLPETYSLSFDAGPRLQVCGVVSSGTAEVRVLEISDADYGGST